MKKLFIVISLIPILGFQSQSGLIDFTLKKLDCSKSGEDKLSATAALAGIGAEAIQPLKNYIHSENDIVVKMASTPSEELWKLSDDDLQARFQEIKCHDSNIQLLLGALARIGKDEPNRKAAVQALTDLLDQPRLQASICESLAKLKDSSSVTSLIKLLRDTETNEEAKDAAMAALKEITGKDLGENAASWLDWYESQDKTKKNNN